MKMLIESVDAWLRAPINNGLKEGLEASAGLLEQLQLEIENNPEQRGQLGALIGKIKGLQKSLNNLEPVNWFELCGGHLAVGHRPSKKMIADLKIQGATHIVTLLSESEGAAEIEKATKKADLNWIHFPMSSASVLGGEELSKLTSFFDEAMNALEQSAKLYIHCSAGIHRTGMISYAFLRYAGQDKKSARATLIRLRQETGERAGDERLAWADKIIDDRLIKPPG